MLKDIINHIEDFIKYIGLTNFQAFVVIGMLIAGFYAKWTIQPHREGEEYEHHTD